MKKRLLSFLCTLALCLGLLPVSALAVDEPYNLWVNGVAVTSENAVDVLGNADGEGATVAYDANTNTLTLNGAALDTAYSSSGVDPGVIYYSGQNELTVKVEGSNTITSETATGIWSSSGGNICLTGTGSLTVETSGSAIAGAGVTIESGTYNLTSTGSNSIYAYSSNIAITGTANVTATSNGSTSIFTRQEIIISDNAYVNAKGYYVALWGETGVEISGGNVTAVSIADYGIYSDSGDIDIIGGIIYAEADGTYHAIYSHGNLTVTGGQITAVADSGDGIYVYDSAMKGASISGDAVVKTNSINGKGIDAYNGLTISGNAVVDASSENGVGILVSDRLAIEGNANVTAKSAQDDAIYSVWALSITGPVTVNAVSEGGVGIATGQTVTVSGGAHIKAEGQTGGISSQNATKQENAVSITGSIVEINTPEGVASIQNTGNTGGISVSDSWLDLSGDDSITPTDSVMFTGTTGEVYGSATVPGDVEVPEGKTLNVPGESSLTVPVDTTLTSNGTVSVEGAVTNKGTIVGDIQNAGSVTNEGIIQGTVTGEGTTTNNGGISEDGGQSFSVNTLNALQGMINNSVGSTDAVIIVLGADITGDLTIPVNANVVIDGGSQYTIEGTVNCDTSTSSADVTNLTLQNLTMDGKNSSSMAIVSQNQGIGSPKVLTGVNSLNLTINNCTVRNYVKKALYLTNAKNLTISGCGFKNNATGQMGDPNISGDYTIDLNLCGVQDTVATITDSTFTDDCGDKAVIKMAVRGGESDGDATDVPLNSTQGNAAASAKSLTISGCTFSDSPAATADVNIGTDSKKVKNGEKFTENTTGAYTVTLSNNKTAVTVFDASKTYKTDDGYYLAEGGGTEKAESITVPAGKTAMKTPNGDLTIESNTGGITTPTEPEEPEEDSWPFVDVTEDAWYYEAVKYVYENGLMIGTADDTFAPNSTLSRAMVAQILYNLEGQPTADGESTFTDASGHWAANAIAWAQETGAVSGYENNTFRPNRAVTREELAQMLYNYAQYKDYDLTATGDLSQFSDGDKVQDWAEEAVSWANGNGLINGHDDGTLEPGGNATRAQAASILMNFDLNLVEE